MRRPHLTRSYIQRSHLRGSLSSSKSVQPCEAYLTRIPCLPDESPESTILQASSQFSTRSVQLRGLRHNEQAASESKRGLSYSTRKFSLEPTGVSDPITEFACEYRVQANFWDSSFIPLCVIIKRSTPSPLEMSRATADFIALRIRGLPSSTDRPSLYSDSRTPIAISAPVPTAANLSPRTDPIGSKTNSSGTPSSIPAIIVCVRSGKRRLLERIDANSFAV